MKYKDSAKEIYELVGKEENIRTLTHCMTRLRFVLKDETKVDDQAVRDIPGVMGINKNAGQYQVIMGNDVASYYKELAKLGDFTADSRDDGATSREKKKPFDAFIDVISSCMSPLIPALIGGGMIKVLMILLPLIGLLSEKSSTYAVLSFFGDAPFYFLPVMLAYTAAKKFDVTPMLAVTIAGIMLHPNFVAMVDKGDPVNVFGLPITLASYSSSVIPILIMVWLMKYIERYVDKITPTVMKSFIKPLFIIVISGVIALVIVGPLGTYVGEGLSAIVLWLQSKVGWLALGFMAAVMPLIVMTGMHWAFAPLFLAASVAHPDVLILPAMLASNLAQGSASLAVALKAKDKNLKQVGVASGISALLAGVTEPALYGITLKYKKPLYATMISGAICGIYLGITHVKSFAFAVPSLVSLPQFIPNGVVSGNFINALIVAIASIVITFILTWIFGIDEKIGKEAEDTMAAVESGGSDPKKIYAPVKGKIMPLEKVKDSVFSSKMMGDGVAIMPEDNTIFAPFSGTVSAIFPTKHAIGLTSDSGIELLIHIGINTVELNGKFFEALVEVNQHVAQGEPLLHADFDKIKESGYDIVTPVIVTNTDAYIDVVAKDDMEEATEDDAILYVV